MPLLQDMLHAVEHGAALVYHEVVAIEADVTKWTTDHPEIGPLIAEGTTYVTGLMTSAGLPVAPLVAAGTAVLAALKQLAAQDTDVTSGGAVNAARQTTVAGAGTEASPLVVEAKPAANDPEPVKQKGSADVGSEHGGAKDPADPPTHDGEGQT